MAGRPTNTTPGKVKAFATVVVKDEDGKRGNDCNTNVVWNDLSGEPHSTPLNFTVDENGLMIQGYDRSDSSPAPNTGAEAVREAFAAYIKAVNARRGTVDARATLAAAIESL